ncbi:MAG: isoprenylcysteine carboxylmethyltransferase family protein [Candidatus Lokiarchaeota archaeon]|nr:isoprenylcysteine carboxylmethyltransferase family protein [Candidatus Lokiarchaeota archaeon]
MSEKNNDSNPVIKFILMYIILALALFFPAGTILWIQGGIYISIMIICSSIFIIYLKKKDPGLLAARVKTKTTESWDKKIGLFASIFILAMYILPGFDAVRFHWSSIPLLINIIGFIGMILAAIFFFLVSRENTYLSRVVEIQKERGHKVITTGPYKIVRHPMYLAVIVLYICHCLALGSLYSLVPCIGLIITIILRIYYEDKKLHEELEGYKEYAKKTRYKLIPGIW